MSPPSGEAEGARGGNSSGNAFFSKIAQVAGNASSLFTRTAASAQEVFADSELRKKARGKLVEGVSAGVKGIGVTAEYVRRNVLQNVGGGIESGKRGVQGVLERVQMRLQQQRVSRALQLTRDTPVDIQIGFHVYEGVPQEMRSRYWLVLVSKPYLAKPFQEFGRFPDLGDFDPDRPQAPGSTTAISDQAAKPQANNFYFVTNPPTPSGSTHAEGSSAHGQHTNQAADNGPGGALNNNTSPSSSASPAAQSQIPDISDGFSDHTAASASMGRSLGPIVRGGQIIDDPEPRPSDDAAPFPTHTHCNAAGGDQEADGWEVVDKLDSLQDSNYVGPASFVQSVRLQQPPVQDAAQPSPRRAAGESEHAGAVRWSGEGEAEEAGPSGEQGDAEGGEADPVALKRRQQERAALRLRQAMDGIKTSMIALTWPVQEHREPGSKYDTLLQVTVGQEEVEEVIRRDIHRTFPEHPRFLLGQSQEELFNVLKAYSMIDMEVGYCQGMAFIAGILLMYMPEQIAFQVFCQLLSPDGPNVRRYYLPGLDDLKLEMAKFEWLLERHLPRLARHLGRNGVPCVLYASQWLLTIFACPFPVDFTARLLDVMLLEQSDSIMMQTAIAIMAECEETLLKLNDFEDIITLLKTEPCQWPDEKLRGLLTAAYLSSVSEEELQLASQVVTVENVDKMMNSPAGPRRRTGQQASFREDVGQEGSVEEDNAVLRASDSGSGSLPGMSGDIAGLVEQQMDTLKWAGPVEPVQEDAHHSFRSPRESLTDASASSAAAGMTQPSDGVDATEPAEEASVAR